MTEPETTPRRGRRARALSPEESAALETRAAREATGEHAAVPGVRGAVAPPTAETPVPTLRKFGRRARIIELTEAPEPEQAPASAGPDHAEEQGRPADVAAPSSSDPAGMPGDGTGPDADAVPSASTAVTRTASTAVALPATPAPIAVNPADRDHDGVELGELSVTEAPDPRPAPRFQGQVLHRPERSGSRALVWVVWALIALALIALVALLLTGIIGPGQASAAAHQLGDPVAVSTIHPLIPEEAAA